ncbi:MAG: hypothetical protein C7B44_01060 [Sulfobacillus thermosulfidooxidans]|nr:MAG: hypothetical protein C7B44_01060 [Sulfobacillus thermosulfidooxidans]
MSATNILRQAWQQIWRKPGSLVLAFWYLFIIFLFQLLVVKGLGSGFETWLKAFNPAKMSTMAQFPPLPHGLLPKLILVYLTMFLIIFPFVIGALYGGVADGLKGQQTLAGLFTFFRYGLRNFWESLGTMVGIFIGSGIAVAVMLLLNLLFSLLAHNGGVIGLIGNVIVTILTLVIIFYWMSIVLYWMGAVFYGKQPVFRGFREAVSWVSRHLGESIRLMLLNALLVIVATLFFGLFSLVPIIGEFFALVLYALVIALIATESALFYRDSSRGGAPPLYRV